MMKSSKKKAAPHILLVEPDTFLADIYEKNLLLEDFRVTKAESGERAITILKNKDINAVLLSLALPKMNGFETLEMIKKDKHTAGLPVIILSKLGAKEDVDRAKSLGAAQYIIKAHFHPSEVVDKIKKLLLQKNDSVL